MLLTDAYGSKGGIAQFNRNFLQALSLIPEVEEVIVLPRIKPRWEEGIPNKVKYLSKAANTTFSYLLELLKIRFGWSRYDVVICGHIYLLPLAAFAKVSLIKKKLFLIMHGIDVWKERSNLTWLRRKSVGRVDEFISVSNFTRNKFLEWANNAKGRFSILPNCIDLNNYSVAPKNNTLEKRLSIENKKIIMTMARMDSVERYKGFDEVLEILPAMVDQIPNLHYLVLGDGSDRKRLVRKAKELGVDSHVSFLGYVQEEEKLDYLRLADAYVMPGYGEGFGIVYLEALACGIPVVASSKDASGEWVNKFVNGWVVDPEKEGDIIEAVKNALATSRKIDEGCLINYSFQSFQERASKILFEHRS